MAQILERHNSTAHEHRGCEWQVGIVMYGNKRQGGYSREPREMHDAKCSDCGAQTQVPFKPTEGRPVYCRDCFQKHKPKDRF